MATATKTKKSTQATPVMTIAQVKNAQFGSLKKYWEGLGKKVSVGTNTQQLRDMVFAHLVERALAGDDIEVSPEDIQAFNEMNAIASEPAPTPNPESEKCVFPASETHPITPETPVSTEVVQPANTAPSKPEPTRSKAPGKKKAVPVRFSGDVPYAECDFAASETPNLEQEAIGKDNQGNQVILVRPNLEQLEAENAKFAAMKVNAPEPKKKAEKPVKAQWSAEDDGALQSLLSAPNRTIRAVFILQLVQKHGNAVTAQKTGLSISKISREAMARRIYDAIPRVKELHDAGDLSWAAIHDKLAVKSIDKHPVEMFVKIAEETVKKRAENRTNKQEKPEKTPAKPRSKAAQIQQFFVKEILEFDAWADSDSSVETAV